MRIQTRGASRLYAPLALVPLLAQHAYAQLDLPDLGQLSDIENLPTSTKAEETKSEATSKETTKETTKETSTAKTSSKDDDETSTGSAASASSAPSITDAPSLSTTSNSAFKLTGLPTIAGAGIPTMIVPNTAQAPFMQKSNLPEGTVFIVVAAILGFLAFCVLVWRASIAWSLKQSVRRAAMAQTLPDSKALLAPGGAPNAPGSRGRVYPHGTANNMSSSLSLEKLSNAGKGTSLMKDNPKRKSTGPAPGPSTSLFFSPTAGAGIHTSTSPVPGISPSATRTPSAYLPAGYYPTGTGLPAGGANSTTLGAVPGAPMGGSLLNMGPSAQGYQRARSLGTDEPGSPQLPPSRGYDRGSVYDRSSIPSTSTLNLGAPRDPNQRVPSAYLEDIFNRQDGRDRF
ncbi:hypothetical protein P152DRAFT_389913 [Eremomyces bilateralis CBS 781.70]|uniref:Uncharacterized protein n=1 Tax=Eremomyces bilateralis CBS 781.70 TaxID=1392243 RepID=A0A6G1GD62_9PEZI|nr:uncharacterized protein P152DRAFT_389913 [Eremomyces bilateralis CBS 781.70]KAF1815846.1 hypothetical protein P152DRAFT_389913 [Eremomyces bilateralis CBS 781.70]